MRRFLILIATLFIFGALAVLPAAAAGDTPCFGSLPTQLTVGAQGQIAQRFSTLRDSPGGVPIQIMYAPATFTVIGGPACGAFDSLTYFEIDYGGGLTGWASESQIVSEWGYNLYWLTPTDAPPPPPPPPPEECPGSLPTQLAVNGRGQIAEVFSTLRPAPGAVPGQIIYAPAQFTVLEGPVCDSYLNYWRIRYDDGLEGWAAESQTVSPWGYNRYWLIPVA
jgi:hypothetical protein